MSNSSASSTRLSMKSDDQIFGHHYVPKVIIMVIFIVSLVTTTWFSLMTMSQACLCLTKNVNIYK